LASVKFVVPQDNSPFRKYPKVRLIKEGTYLLCLKRKSLSPAAGCAFVLEQPADLSVESLTKFEFIIKLKAAKQIGFTIPPNVLARADKGRARIALSWAYALESLMPTPRGTKFGSEAPSKFYVARPGGCAKLSALQMRDTGRSAFFNNASSSISEKRVT
jgi:hypothetical protein